MRRRRLKLAAFGVAMAWDTGWKIAAIVRAIRMRQYRWIAPLAVVNSAGILPMVYLKRWAKPQPKSGAAILTSPDR